ncbi:hypothetical protein GOV05_04380 [Candidatus Woesearchaeota archaeon]|nr:hypothetical protein [Candidatus Woesearchaeota archaeon]
MRGRFCPGCGKSISKEQEFCSSCKPKKELSFKDMNLKFCLNCDKLKVENAWGKHISLESGITSLAKKKVKEKNYEVVSVDIPEIIRKPGISQTAEMIIRFDGEEYVLPVNIDVTTCPSCSKISDTYVEGTLQLRGVSQEVKDYVWDYVEKNNVKGVNVNKHSVVRGGEDFVFNSKRHMKRLAQLLKRRFGGEVKEAAQLFSHDRQTSKDIIRLNIVYREKKE